MAINPFDEHLTALDEFQSTALFAIEAQPGSLKHISYVELSIQTVSELFDWNVSLENARYKQQGTVLLHGSEKKLHGLMGLDRSLLSHVIKTSSSNTWHNLYLNKVIAKMM